MIAFYNSHVGDVLMLVMADDTGLTLDFERRADVTRVFSGDLTVGWNFFGGFESLTDGPQDLTAEDVAALNHRLASAGFEEALTADVKPKFVIAKIEKMEEHPDSDHLHVCQVNIGASSLTQIVCGAPNAREGLLTVAALPGTMMPNGALIWPGKLRNVVSNGMLCSARELALPNAPEKRGIIELESGEPGQKFA